MTAKYQLFYIIFLIIVVVGVGSTLIIDFEDKGACIYLSSGEIRVRQPGTATFVPSAYCIIINH